MFKPAYYLITLCLLASCNGLLDDIYDEVDDDAAHEYGFVRRDSDGRGGTIYLDVQSYKNWYTIDFHNRTIDSVNIEIGMDDPEQWDLALHRYDVKTNGGVAAASNFNSVAEIDMSLLDGLVYHADIEDSVIIDMSTMMDGYVGKAASRVNEVLSGWLDVDTREMPPIYTLSKKVYIVRFADQTRAALYFSNFMNEASKKGFATIEYRYPL